jgi:hypothetical protein
MLDINISIPVVRVTHSRYGSYTARIVQCISIALPGKICL